MSESLSLLIPPPLMQGSCRSLVVSCFCPRNDVSMALICMNWSMICWSTEERPETVLGLVTCGGCNVVSVDCKLISILSVSVEVLEMLCAEVMETLAPLDCVLKPDDLLSPLHLMCDFRK